MTTEPRPDGPDRPERAQLPTDAAALEPMGDAFDEALDAGLRELGLEGDQAGSDVARESYERHARLLRAWGAAINLTAIRQPDQIAWRHVCDALSAVRLLRRRLSPGASLLDLGSGAGYPGLPLAAALPLGRVGLLDSTAKKARFLAVAGAEVERTVRAGRPATEESLRIHAIGERAEDLAEEEDERATWDVVTARALGSLAEVVELGLPLVGIGGFVVAWKREGGHGGLSAELRGAGSIIRACGGGRPDVEVIDVDVFTGHRLVIVPKLRETPATYPRPAAVRRGRR